MASCSVADSLYQLEFVVKTVTRCGRPEDNDGGCTAVGVRFLEHAEQTVCVFPATTAGAAAVDCSAEATVTCVNRGKRYTFAMPKRPAPGCDGGPKPIRVDVRLYRQLGADPLPGRVEIASGFLDVALPSEAAAGTCCPAEAVTNEQTVSMTGCPDGRIVAVLTVCAQTSCVGAVAEATIERPVPCKSVRSQPRPQNPCCLPDPSTPDKCCPPPPPDKCCQPPVDKCCPPPPKDKCCPPPVNKCCPPPPKDKCCRKKCCCGGHVKKPVQCCKKKPVVATCCPTPQRECRPRCDVFPAAEPIPEPHRQYSTVACELDGHKVDLRVRKKNYETCAVQKQIANEADAFAGRVMAAVREMHGLVALSKRKSDDSM